MPNEKTIPQAFSLAWLALTWAGAAMAGTSPVATDDGNLLVLAGAGTVTLLVAVLLWRRSRAALRAKKPDTSAFLTLEQITRLESPGDGATLMKVAQPKPIPSRTAPNSASGNQHSSPSDVYMSELEKQYPRIVEKLVAIWPAPESDEYVQNLTFDERGGREGFGREVAAEIMLLHSIKVKPHKGVWL